MIKKTEKAKQENSALLIPIRYIILFCIAFCLYYSFFAYKILFNLTAYPLNFILNLFSASTLNGSFLLIGKNTIELIPACIAVSAYVFLLILNLATPMPAKIRIKSLIFSLVSLFVINILRLIILSSLFIGSYASFDIVHKFTWYFLSILIVIALWFSSVKLFKIRNIPVYSDFKALLNSTETKTKK